MHGSDTSHIKVNDHVRSFPPKFLALPRVREEADMWNWGGARLGDSKRNVYSISGNFASVPKLPMRPRGAYNDTTRSSGAGNV